jgi:hypothetical protein
MTDSFERLGEVDANIGGLYFLEGDYTVEIADVKKIKNRNKQDVFIVAATVLESTNPKIIPGCKPSQVIVMKQEYLETCLANVKAFLAAMLEIDDPKNFVPENNENKNVFWLRMLKQMSAEDQPARGTKIHLNCVQIKTKTGKDYTRHQWGPVIEAAA